MADTGVSLNDMAVPIAIVVAFAALLSLGAYLYYRWNKARLKRIAEEGEEAPPERAANEITRVKGIERVLAEQGIDTSAALAHIAGAERRMRDGDTADALARAKLAKEALMQAKGARKEPDAKAVDLLNLPPPTAAAPEPEEKTLKEQLKEKVPRNFLESRFAIDSARGLVDAMPAVAARDEARKALDAAQASFDAEDYDRAFTRGCRARRLAGAQSVFVSEESGGQPAEKTIVVPEAPSASDVPVVITKSYDLPAGAPTGRGGSGEEEADAGGAIGCPSCGAPAQEGDRFCRKCGARMAASCGSCGREASDGDRFCRGCGEKLA